MPRADNVWMIGYVAHIQGAGIGLYAISKDMIMQKHPERVSGTYANRMIHNPSNKAFMFLVVERELL